MSKYANKILKNERKKPVELLSQPTTYDDNIQNKILSFALTLFKSCIFILLEFCNRIFQVRIHY